MSTSLPSAEPTPSPSRPALRKILHIAFWGVDAQTLARDIQAHALTQPGWTERLHITAHDLPHADCLEAMQTWLTSELQTSGTRPHLSLLVPSGAAQNANAGELQLRNALISAGVSFQVLYGATSEERIRNTTNAIALTAKAILPSSERACFVVSDIAKPINPRMRSWNCEKCSDPECEHRLFTGLLPA
ncbi:hypothetical protein G7048_04875 [Diaphorobacter sp. HDW4B]|uniref:hypothetical protein n=1 Tax=Diaphorobacter sp. HDW4B TaxID=2714925 RepID=UPI0014087140|nr:hypothetical protein [Diaphorobacter sp. HDW4B]QIL69755.1 hypothetical protein G7048_04875 [Diaphorobacter sp. HDW4B]